jgi:hypothetical protein
MRSATLALVFCLIPATTVYPHTTPFARWPEPVTPGLSFANYAHCLS